jgi:hypothetical protein
MFNDNRNLPKSWMRESASFWPAILAGILFCATARAVAPAPLPSFSVQGLDGSSISTSAWPSKGKSVLIYVRGDCQPCAALLGRLRKKDYPQLAAHATIIVGDAGPAGVKTLQQLYPDLSSAIWYADSSRAAATALHLQGAPVILGLNGNIVQWALSCVMEHPTQQRSILNTWCAK